MIFEVKENPAPVTQSSDLTGRKPKRGSHMVAFRRKRKSAKRKSPKRRKTVRRARRVYTKRRRKNPRRKRAVSRGTHRPRLTYKSGKWYGGKGPRSLIKRGSGTRVNPKRSRRRRRVRRNPAGIRGITKMFNQRILMQTAKAGAGIAIGFTAMPILYRIVPQAMKEKRQWLGGVHVALGLAIAGFMRNRTAKDIGMVIAATGVYDLIAMNVDFLGLPPLRTSSKLADSIFPTQESAPAAVEGCYGGQLDISHYGASYPTAAAPVSPVAATGMGASFERMGSSYPSLAYPTIGLAGDGGTDMGLDDMIN